MKLKHRWVYLFAFSTLWISRENSEASVESESVDSLFQVAMDQVGRMPVKESIKAFRRVLKVDRKYAPAYHEIVKLYMALDTPRYRDQARKTLDRAIHLEPENVSYQLTLGKLLWDQGFWYNAKEQYEKILKSYPENAHAAYGIGYYFLKNFIKYRDMIQGESGVSMDWAQFAEAYREHAIFYLRRSIELNPKFWDAYYQLGVVYLESKQLAAFIQLSKQLLEYHPDDKNALLFCGFAYHTINTYTKAHKFYTKALNRMDPEELATMESVRLLVTKEKHKEMVGADLQYQEEDLIKGWVDSLKLRRFWRKQDPVFLTKFNERRMEHYRRMAYANLYFGRPSKNIEGWQTDKGKTYIKFGHPIHRVIKRPWLKTPDKSKGTLQVYPYVETWYYEGFKISFLNSDGIDGWRFATTTGPVSLRYHLGDKVQSGGLSSQPTSRYVFNQRPPRYIDPYRQQKYSLPYQVAAFQDGKGIRLEIAAAIPKRKLKITGDDTGLERGIFLFDEKWDEVHRDVAQKLDLEPAGTHSFKIRYLVSQHTVHVDPRQYNVVVEFRDRRQNFIGTFRTVCTFLPTDTLLSISDLLLASQIEAQDSLPEGRTSLKVVPNPLRTYSPSESVNLYFEIYNLTRDEFGRTEYEVSYQVGWPEKEEIDPALFPGFSEGDAPEAKGYVKIEIMTPEEESDLGFSDDIVGRGTGHKAHVVDYRVTYVEPRKKDIFEEIQKRGTGGEQVWETAVTARYEGNDRNDLTYMSIDVSRLPIGVYKLIVTVKDLQTGQMAERDVLFRMIE